MKKAHPSPADAGTSPHSHSEQGGNGHAAVSTSELTSPDLGLILAGLQTMRDGDFSVRLPVSWTGLEGKIADTFNDIIAVNEQMARELKRVGLAVGKEGKTRERTRFQQ